MMLQWVAAYPIPVNKGIDAAIKVLDSPAFKPNRSSRQPRIGMAFTGQGAQWHASRCFIDANPPSSPLRPGRKKNKKGDY